MQQRTKRLFAVILFLDIVGFTDFSEKNDPEIVDDYLSFFFDFCSKQIKKNNGWVEKYIGDAICAIFYSSTSSTKDSINACNCAYNIISNIEKFNRENKFPFSVRIGIDCGVVTTTKRDQYDVFVGQAINSAARIQSVAHPNTCFVSEKIAKFAKDSFEFCEIGDFELKGISEKVKVFKLENKIKINEFKLNTNFYFSRKEEIELVKIFFQDNYKKIAIRGYQGSGKTTLLIKFIENLKKISNFDIVFISLNDWDSSIEELSQLINIKKIEYEITNNKKKILVIDNFNCQKSPVDSISFINNLKDFEFIILSYTIDEFLEDKINQYLINNGFKVLNIDSLSFEEFDNFLQMYFEKPVFPSFEIKLYKLSRGFIGRAYNFISLLKNELNLSYEQLISLDIEQLLNSRVDLLEHCYRINGIDNESQILLSLIAYSFQPLDFETLKSINTKLNIADLEYSLALACEKGWIYNKNGFYVIENEYLRQFIINSTSHQLKKSVINILLENSQNVIDKIFYILQLYEEDKNIFYFDEEKVITEIFINLENQTIQSKLSLLKKLLNYIDVPFFNKIIKFILLDKRLYPYLLNLLNFEDLEIIINNFNDLKTISSLENLKNLKKPKDLSDFHKNILNKSNDCFYHSLFRLLLYPEFYIENYDLYENLLNPLEKLKELKKDYFTLFSFPYIDKCDELICDKLNKTFEENIALIDQIEKIYLNHQLFEYNKLQLFFILVENISCYIYFKKKPIFLINKMLGLCEKIILELNYDILKEFFYGLFFYTQFTLSNFQYYGLHNDMDFNLLPNLKIINEIIYKIYSFSFDFNNEISFDNKANLFLNPPYYIPFSVSLFYYKLLSNQKNEKYLMYKEKLNKNLKSIEKKFLHYKEKNFQIKDFAKIIINLD